MPAKDITPSQEDKERSLDAAVTLAEDIHKRWPIWVELADKNLGMFSSPHMLIAVHLLSSGMQAMLYAQMPAGVIAKSVEQLFDMMTNPDYLTHIAEMREDKASILAFCDRLLRDQANDMVKHKAAN